MELNRNPGNYFGDVGQPAFNAIPYSLKSTSSHATSATPGRR